MGLLSAQDEATLKQHLSVITIPVQLVLFTQSIGGSESGPVTRQILGELADLYHPEPQVKEELLPSVLRGAATGLGALGVSGRTEAAEMLLGLGFQPRRTVYFAFGHDEERGGTKGAAAIAALVGGSALARSAQEGPAPAPPAVDLAAAPARSTRPRLSRSTGRRRPIGA